jgi:hypothetical protein
MGGSGGTRRHRDNGGGEHDTCELIRFDTVLLSPDVARLEAVHVGMILDVAVSPDGGTGTVGVYDEARNLLGSVSHLSVGKLLRCIRDGHAYVAEVLKIEGAECRVRIRYRH